MPTILTDPAQLATAHTRFVQALQAALTQTIPCTVSGVGGGFDTEAAYSPELDLWCARAQQDKKCWNGFGLGAPVAGKKVSLAAEINFPSDGINRALSGTFAADENGDILVHRRRRRQTRHLRPNRQPERHRFPRKTRRFRAPNPRHQSCRQTRCGIIVFQAAFALCSSQSKMPFQPNRWFEQSGASFQSLHII